MESSSAAVAASQPSAPAGDAALSSSRFPKNFLKILSFNPQNLRGTCCVRVVGGAREVQEGGGGPAGV